MENNPKRKTEETGDPDRPDRAGKENRKTRRGSGKIGDTAYDRLNKALETYEKVLKKKPDDADAWAGKAAVF